MGHVSITSSTYLFGNLIYHRGNRENRAILSIDKRKRTICGSEVNINQTESKMNALQQSRLTLTEDFIFVPSFASIISESNY